MEKNLIYHIKHPVKTSNKIMGNPLAKLAIIGLCSYGMSYEVEQIYDIFQNYDSNNLNSQIESDNTLKSSGLELKL